MPTTRLCSTLCLVTLTSSLRLVEDGQLHVARQDALFLDFLDLLLDGIGNDDRFLILAHQHDAFDNVVFVPAAQPAAHDPQPRLVPFHHLGDVAHQDRVPLVRRDNDVANIVELVVDELGAAGHVLRLERVNPLAEQPDPAHDVRLAAQGEDVSRNVGVGLLDRVLNLLERDTVVVQLHRVDQHQVLLDRAAKAGHVDYAGNRLERALHHPVLNRLDLVQGITGAFEHVAHNLAGRAPRREHRIDSGRQVRHRVHPVDDLLTRLPVVRVVAELALDVAEPRDRRAAQVFEPGHPVQRDLDRDAD